MKVRKAKKEGEQNRMWRRAVLPFLSAGSKYRQTLKFQQIGIAKLGIIDQMML